MGQVDKYSLDLIMLSKFGMNDGGRETWAYNFLPRLINNSEIYINVFGYRIKGEEDNSGNLLNINASKPKKINPYIIVGKKSKLPRFFSMLIGLRAVLKHTERSNYVLGMGIFELIMMLVYSKFRSSKKIVWLRGIFLNEKSSKIPTLLMGFCKKMEIFLLSRADIVIANGDDIKMHYAALGISLSVIKNSVDYSKWHLGTVQKSKSLNVAYIGRLSKVKGIESFLALVKDIKLSKYADFFQFHIVGQANDYLDEVKSLNDNVIYHGQINNNDLPNFLTKVDICVALTFASKNSGGGGTSNALMEQMAASRILIAWDNVIFQQLLDHNTAYLVKQSSTDSLKHLLLEIYFNQENAIEKSINASKFIKPFTFASQVEKFKKILKSTH